MVLVGWFLGALKGNQPDQRPLCRDTNVSDGPRVGSFRPRKAERHQKQIAAARFSDPAVSFCVCVCEFVIKSLSYPRVALANLVFSTAKLGLCFTSAMLVWVD